jgi:hypothetical protein
MEKRTVLPTDPDRDRLERLIAAGAAPAHARGLRGPGWADEWVAEAVEASPATVARVRKRFVEEGLAALGRRPPRREYRRKPDGEQEARLAALARGEPPTGQARWPLRLLAGRRWAAVTERRTAADRARRIEEMVEVRYPEAERIALVPDNLDTHSPAPLDEALPPARAKRLADKLEIHHAPKHGSRLNVRGRTPLPKRGVRGCRRAHAPGPRGRARAGLREGPWGRRG